MPEISEELKATALRAGMINVDDLAMVDRPDIGDPQKLIAWLKEKKPHLFSKPVLDMTRDEYRAAAAKMRPPIESSKVPTKDVRGMSDREYQAERGRIGLSHHKRFYK